MELSNVFILFVAGIVFIALVVFLIWRNKKNKKQLNPGAADFVEETHMDQERKADKI